LKDPGELPSEMTPEIVCTVPEGDQKFVLPEIWIAFATVKLVPPANESVLPAAIDSVPLPSAELLPMTSVPEVSVVPPE
jgi:hypothetical protein